MILSAIFDLKTNQLILKYVIGLHVFTFMPIYFLNKKSHTCISVDRLLNPCVFFNTCNFFVDYIVIRQNRYDKITCSIQMRIQNNKIRNDTLLDNNE